MFDLEQSINAWRRQMLAAGIQDPGVLDELESHLREEMQRSSRPGSSEQAVFDDAVRQMGRAGTLKTEFAKAGGTIREQLRRLLFALAGIPDYQLATNMNTPNPFIESRWATYLKAVAFILPAIVFWVGSLVFVVPKLKEICAASGTDFPKPITFALGLSAFFKDNLIVVALVGLATLILLEWRPSWWPRYRRPVFGVAAFALNLTALILISTLMVFAVIVGNNLLHHVK